ncbi:hypothetical protein JJ34_004276 [Salmonella enterica subsp. salamae]|uniref:Uncharacterized protein n=2 Tax=Salmonella enterica TaxID=28901 RepID=A0A4Q1J778_SALER|nr:hypothetical protein ELZ76_14490 [Salmonella enterica subsp. salamae serovar 42:r:-]EAO0401960.1 hypothetical protein [Salmonella enterica]ECF6040462.1 hypothetical protein [Salmonella enterica subsp. salamae]AZT51290.1 hypothetical protein EL003_14460 [Salmonella enterica subsp. salamae serovar 42:r:-]AZT55715.1 hypothetical protein EL009_14505 [Salmonella enterica subsp. salamae serovar 42:r:-]
MGIEAGSLLRTHGLRYPTRSLTCILPRIRQPPTHGGLFQNMMTEWTLSERNMPDNIENCDRHRNSDIWNLLFRR